MNHTSVPRAAIFLAIAGTAGTAAAGPMDSDERECPAEVRGVRIASTTLRDGVAFTFTVARPKQLSALRTLLREAASIVEHDSKIAALHPDPDVMPASDGSGSIPALDISVRNTPKGAIVTVRPEEVTRIDMVHQNARGFELFWATHDCVDTPRMATPSLTSVKEVASSPRRAARSKATSAGSL